MKTPRLPLLARTQFSCALCLSCALILLPFDAIFSDDATTIGKEECHRLLEAGERKKQQQQIVTNQTLNEELGVESALLEKILTSSEIKEQELVELSLYHDGLIGVRRVKKGFNYKADFFLFVLNSNGRLIREKALGRFDLAATADFDLANNRVFMFVVRQVQGINASRAYDLDGNSIDEEFISCPDHEGLTPAKTFVPIPGRHNYFARFHGKKAGLFKGWRLSLEIFRGNSLIKTIVLPNSIIYDDSFSSLGHYKLRSSPRFLSPDLFLLVWDEHGYLFELRQEEAILVHFFNTVHDVFDAEDLFVSLPDNAGYAALLRESDGYTSENYLGLVNMRGEFKKVKIPEFDGEQGRWLRGTWPLQGLDGRLAIVGLLEKSYGSDKLQLVAIDLFGNILSRLSLSQNDYKRFEGVPQSIHDSHGLAIRLKNVEADKGDNGLEGALIGGFFFGPLGSLIGGINSQRPPVEVKPKERLYVGLVDGELRFLE